MHEFRVRRDREACDDGREVHPEHGLGGGLLPGLYAVGNAAAFWTGDAYPAPGATLGIGMTMGYLAGRHAATRTVRR
jgi:hypothetical protein